ncbi:hypothetical protein SUS17_49 [Sphingomonas sp. S17]|jgi:hypothetical protein|nr:MULTISPECIES: hypothetical protein [Sphingomonas]EGI56864.1 hypothetical protein SUS17_49 [Sphingomonas sp. S17]
MLESTDERTITPERSGACHGPHEQMRVDRGGYRRDHLRALA